MAYAIAEDVTNLTGGIPFPAYISTDQAIKSASDEVDSYIGTRYVTPVALPDVPVVGVDTYRQARLILKHLTAHLAAGRVIMAAAAGGEDDSVHAYGARLVRDALSQLRKIADGDIVLPEVPINPSLPSKTADSMPMVVNGDPYSQVDAFYGIATPGSTFFTNPRF